jgi:glucan endo-1,3-alpha-glucosidase
MIGEINNDHVRQDIIDAQSLGLDGFAMNFDQFQSWSNNTVDRLFNNADDLKFKLFFSFDHDAGKLPTPKRYADFLKTYMARPSYFTFNGKPLVTTFGGESIPDSDWSDLKSAAGAMNLVIGSYRSKASSAFFSNRRSIDGVFNWNSWQDPTTKEKDDVSTVGDVAFQTAAKASRPCMKCM